jgi:hypothetical protein
MVGHSASLRAFTPVFDGLWTRVNALVSRPSTSCLHTIKKDVDARAKRGHDAEDSGAIRHPPLLTPLNSPIN